MNDLVFLGASLAFFLVAGLYVFGCESLKGGGDNA
jgi:hypothetical protein